jgi:hypothetical protein
VKFYCNSENIDIKFFVNGKSIVYGSKGQDRFEFYNFDEKLYAKIKAVYGG